MKKIKLISALVLSTVLSIHAASAGTCSVQNYDEQVDKITDFNKFEVISIAAIGGTGVLLVYLGAEGGTVEGLAIGAGLVGVAGLEWGTIYLVKKAEARHFQEVVNNLLGADGNPAGADAVIHTTNLINDATQATYTPQQVSAAILAAVNSGDLCREDGTLAVTSDFRKIVEAHLTQPQPTTAQN